MGVSSLRVFLRIAFIINVARELIMEGYRAQAKYVISATSRAVAAFLLRSSNLVACLFDVHYGLEAPVRGNLACSFRASVVLFAVMLSPTTCGLSSSS